MNPPPYSENNLTEDFGRLSTRKAPQGDCLIIALDFGTTYSGISYAFTTDPEKVYTVDSWPGGDDRVVPKTPTVIKYERRSRTDFKWGYELDQTLEEKITGLKLLFDPGQRRPYFVPTNIEAELAKLPKPVTEVATDYMRAIFQHALKEIESGYLDPDFVKNYDKQYLLTVPAVWSDKAKDMTSRAARSAGISPIDMITEPEAAALFTLQSMKNKGLQNGDAIVICDAGGGTVDLIAYEIESLNPFEIKALTKPSGGVAGSLMLNRLFEEEIQKTVGDEAYIALKKTDGYRGAVRDFDIAIKLAFRGKNDPDKYVSFPMANLPDNPTKGLIKNSMTLTGATLFRIFDPIVREIDRLVSEQIQNVKIERLQAQKPNAATVKAVFLVGGFGSSAYLKDVIQQSNPGVLVIQPKEAWSAIAKGAVMSKLSLAPTVLSTKAPKHYGTSCMSVWNPIRDRGFTKVEDEYDGVEKCEIMQWFIYMDDELVRNRKISLSFYRTFTGHNPSGTALIIRDELFESTAILAPDHPLDVKVNCVLNTDLNKVPKSHFVKKTRRADGSSYCELSYTLLVENNQSGVLKYSLEVHGKEYAAVDATY